jgi:hypothetical protein
MRTGLAATIATLWVCMSACMLACGSGSGACTEIGCEHEAVVTLPPALVTGPYDLVLRSEGETASARCADPSAPETAENPEGLACDTSGFTLTGHSLANARSVFVTIVRIEDDETLVDDTEVRLDAVGMEQPNGPDCEPTCFVRNGQLVLTEPGM